MHQHQARRCCFDIDGTLTDTDACISKLSIGCSAARSVFDHAPLHARAAGVSMASIKERFLAA